MINISRFQIGNVTIADTVCNNVHEDQEEYFTYNDVSFTALCEVQSEIEIGTLLHKEKYRYDQWSKT